MTRDALIDLARRKAAAHQLWPELVCAISEQESSWNPWAMRYEPAFFSRYVAPLYTNNRISATEAFARAMSWGLMQVMGQVAREHAFAGRFLSELCEPEVNLEIGCVVLSAKLAAAGGNVEKALLLWNGGARTEYAAEVLARAENYR